MKRTNFTKELKEQITQFYLSRPMSFQTVSEKFNICLPSVGKILNGIPIYSKAQIYNPKLKEDFFKIINTEEKAYFLGLLISDGNVFLKQDNNNRQASISITLQNEDKYILERFKVLLNSNTAISSDNRGCSYIAVRSSKMANDLANFGIIPRKSYYTYLPNIPNKLYNHLIRGIMDGDGSIQFLFSKAYNKTYRRICFCGSKQLMQDISDLLFNKLHLKQKPLVYSYKDRKLSEIHINNMEDIYKLGNWIYKDATIFLKRKKDKFELIKNDIYNHDNTEISNESNDSLPS